MRRPYNDFCFHHSPFGVPLLSLRNNGSFVTERNKMAVADVLQLNRRLWVTGQIPAVPDVLVPLEV